jgi:hypothetical protein
VIAVFMTALVLVGLQGPTSRASVPFWSHVPGTNELVVERGQRLLMILGDMTGDGRPEIFIAPARTCGNGGCIWSVYSPTGAPNELRYVGNAAFSPEAYRIDSSALLYCWHKSAASCQIGESRIIQDRIQTRDLGECRVDDPACTKRLDTIRSWQRSSARLLFEAAVANDRVLRGLHWTARNNRASPNALPDLDHLVVVADNRK